MTGKEILRFYPAKKSNWQLYINDLNTCVIVECLYQWKGGMKYVLDLDFLSERHKLDESEKKKYKRKKLTKDIRVQ